MNSKTSYEPRWARGLPCIRLASWGVGGRRFKSFHADQIPQQNQSIRVGFVVCGMWLRCETGWDEQECRDAAQHNFNAWIKEFGTGNKKHQQIIELTEGFLNAYGLSRFAATAL